MSESEERPRPKARHPLIDRVGRFSHARAAVASIHHLVPPNCITFPRRGRCACKYQPHPLSLAAFLSQRFIVKTDSKHQFQPHTLCDALPSSYNALRHFLTNPCGSVDIDCEEILQASFEAVWSRLSQGFQGEYYFFHQVGGELVTMVLKEIADFGFMVACRFYGRYPETGPRFYHPPCCESDRCDAGAACENGRRRAPARRSGLAMATLFILPSVSAPDFSEYFTSGAFQDFDGVLPSPAPQSVGAH